MWLRWGPLALAVAGLLAYLTSFWGQMLFDDKWGIENVPEVQSLLPLSQHFGLSGDFNTIFTFALSRALNETLGFKPFDPWSFHLINLAIHLGAGLAVFGLVHRTLKHLDAPWLQDRAPFLALATGLLWAVHPLQTQAVTYLVQRRESLAALCYLLTLYCAVRGWERGRYSWWHGLSVLICQFGMGCKPTMITAPAVVLLYDRAFVAKSFLQAVRRHHIFLVLLFLTCTSYLLPHARQHLALLQPRAEGAAERSTSKDASPAEAPDAKPKRMAIQTRIVTADISKDTTAWQYLITMGRVQLHYLRLLFWPDVLCLDYGWQPVRRALDAPLTCLFWVLLLGAGAWSFWRNGGFGFLLASYLVFMSPRFVIRMREFLFEHHMYLPQVAFITTLVLGAARWGPALLHLLGWRKPRHTRLLALCLVGALATALGVRTALRNWDYSNHITFWEKNVRHRPGYWRPRLVYGTALIYAGRYQDAATQFEIGLRLAPTMAQGYNNLAGAYYGLERYEDALKALDTALERGGPEPDAYQNRGMVLEELGRKDEAAESYRQALEMEPLRKAAQHRLGAILVEEGKAAEALPLLRSSLDGVDNPAEGHYNLATALAMTGQVEDSIRHFQKSLELDPRLAEAHVNLANVYLGQKKLRAAEAHYAKALSIDPTLLEANLNLGNLKAMRQDFRGALAHYQAALRQAPGRLDIHRNLALALIQSGQPDKAVSILEQVLKHVPEDAKSKALLKAAKEKLAMPR